MTYSESAQGVMITPDRARKELATHGAEADFDLFCSEVTADAHGMYNAGDVLNWLGY